MVLGAGFLDAYRMTEKRSDAIRNVCAFAISPSFLAHITNSEHFYRLLCLYKDHFFLNPEQLTDPDMGKFDNRRILSLLRQAGANPEKLEATRDFLGDLEDYDDAMLPGSRSPLSYGLDATRSRHRSKIAHPTAWMGDQDRRFSVSRGYSARRAMVGAHITEVRLSRDIHINCGWLPRIVRTKDRCNKFNAPPIYIDSRILL